MSTIFLTNPVYAKIFTGRAVRVVAVVAGHPDHRVPEANLVCEQNPGMCVLAEHGDVVYLAMKSDDGVQPTKMETFQS